MPAPTKPPLVWLHVRTLGIGHVVALVLACVALAVAVLVQVHGMSYSVERREAVRMGNLVLRNAEHDFELVAKVLRTLDAEPADGWCSANHIQMLSRVDFEISEVKGFGVVDRDGNVLCTSRQGLAPAPIPEPAADARYEDITVHVAFVPLSSRIVPVYALGRGRILAATEGHWWLQQMDSNQFIAGVRDRRSGKPIVAALEGSSRDTEAVIQGDPFIVEVRGAGAVAAA